MSTILRYLESHLDLIGRILKVAYPQIAPMIWRLVIDALLAMVGSGQLTIVSTGQLAKAIRNQSTGSHLDLIGGIDDSDGRELDF